MQRHQLSSIHVFQHDEQTSRSQPLRDVPEVFISINANWRFQRHDGHTGSLDPQLRQSLHSLVCSSGTFPTLACINGDLAPVPFTWFIGYLFGQDGEVEEKTGTAHYATYVEEWRAVTSRLKTEHGRPNLAGMLHRSVSQVPTLCVASCTQYQEQVVKLYIIRDRL